MHNLKERLSVALILGLEILDSALYLNLLKEKGAFEHPPSVHELKILKLAEYIFHYMTSIILVAKDSVNVGG